MRRRELLLGVLLSLAVAEAFADVDQESRVQSLTRELRCLVCQNQSIADSDAPLAADLRREVRSMVAAGASDQEVVAFMTERYGDFVRYRPPFNPSTWLLWAGPFLLLGGGVGVLVAQLRRREGRA